MLIFFKWFCAHLLGDFTFQSRAMVLHKRKYKARSGYLYLHVCIHGALIYLLTGWWTNWELPLAVIITHFAIDLWKLYRKDSLFYFLLDQFLHIAVLAALWWWYQAADRSAFFTACRVILGRPSLWIIVAAYIIIIWPSALVLGYLTKQWREAVEQRITPERPGTAAGGGVASGIGAASGIGTESGVGLASAASGAPHPGPSIGQAGKWIGVFERMLVLTFILTNHFEGIGFLIAAKSILRFGDRKEGDNRTETEYILIGTLMSFSTSILIGLACRYLLMN